MSPKGGARQKNDSCRFSMGLGGGPWRGLNDDTRGARKPVAQSLAPSLKLCA